MTKYRSVSSAIDAILHLDATLPKLVAAYGPWIYALLFGIVFAETGLLVGFFLPGDSLLFTVGVVAGAGQLNIAIIILLLICASMLGDWSGYLIGRRTDARRAWGDGLESRERDASSGGCGGVDEGCKHRLIA